MYGPNLNLSWETSKHKLTYKIDFIFIIDIFEEVKAASQKMRTRRGIETTPPLYRCGTEAHKEEVTCQFGERAKTSCRLRQLIIKPKNINVGIRGIELSAARSKEKKKLCPGPEDLAVGDGDPLTAVHDSLDIAKAVGALVDDTNVQRIFDRKSSGWEGYPNPYLPYPQPCFTQSPLEWVRCRLV